MAEARPSLERALSVSHIQIEQSWVGEELHLTGPGASAQVALRAGLFVGRASLRPPASFFSSVIQNGFEDALRRAADEHDPLEKGQDD